MPKVRQLPETYLRGSLANETMKFLKEDQKLELDRVYHQIVNHPILQGHKYKFKEKLGATIAADYYDDPEIAQQDYNIAIWRATVHLLFHSEYRFRCRNCDNSTYMSAMSKSITFDRRYPICPNCNNVEITDPGQSDLSKGCAIEHNRLLVLLDELCVKGLVNPKWGSCIESSTGDNKVENPYDIINDADQVKKYYGQFIWNYFRQIINENEITTHGKKVNTVSGPADKLATDMIACALSQCKTDYDYNAMDNPRNGSYRIICNPYATPVNFTLQLCEVKRSVRDSGVKINITPNEIAVVDLKGDSPFIEVSIVSRDIVSFSGSGKSSDDDDSLDPMGQIRERTMYEQGLDSVETTERLKLIREALPDGNCRKVFDLYIGESPIYDQFAASDKRAIQVNNGKPRQNKVAEFLGTTTKEIKKHHETISIQILRYGLIEC